MVDPTMEYAAVRKPVEHIYEWIGRYCQDTVYSKRGRSRIVHWYAFFGEILIICVCAKEL